MESHNHPSPEGIQQIEDTSARFPIISLLLTDFRTTPTICSLALIILCANNVNIFGKGEKNSLIKFHLKVSALNLHIVHIENHEKKIACDQELKQ